MKTIRIVYNINDPDSVQKAFEAVNLLKKGNIEAIPENQILNDNKMQWEAAQRKHIEIIQDWELGAILIQDNKCLFNDKVYVIKQTHTVTDPNHTPDITLALYRPAPEIAAGRIYPLWSSIGLLDSVNYWGDKSVVDHNGKYWLSNNPANIWEPGAVGSDIWEEIGGEAEDPGEPDLCETAPDWNGANYLQYVKDFHVKHNNAIWKAKNTTHTWIAPAHTGDGAVSWEFVKNCL